MKKLLKYETPSARLIEIHTESFICGSMGAGMGDLGENGEIDDDN